MQCLRCSNEASGSKALCDKCLGQGRLLGRPTAVGREPEVRVFDDSPSSDGGVRAREAQSNTGLNSNTSIPGSIAVEGVGKMEITGYAGFWLRVWAYLLDIAVLGAFTLLVQLIAGSLIESIVGLAAGAVDGAGAMSMVLTGATLGSLAVILITSFSGLIYYVIFEASKYQATPGKLFIGLIVTDESGHRLTFGPAIMRYVARAAPWIVILLGLLLAVIAGKLGLLVAGLGALLIPAVYIMAAFTEHKQALHDKIAGTLVCRTARTTGPRCVIAVVIAIIVIAGCITFGPKSESNQNNVKFKNFRGMQGE